jgi:hypothetical protein
MAYRYRDKVFRFLLNGQTGKAFGQAPFDWKKILIPLAIAGGILLAVALAFGIVAAMSAV